MEREKLKSRLGFILISAGCAIGIGNVWKFPWMAGQNGGGIFVLIYLICLLVMGVPALTTEFALGRLSQKSPVKLYQALEKPGQKWHIHGYVAYLGNILLLMFYTMVAGWMVQYFVLTATGAFTGLDNAAIGGVFDSVLANPSTLLLYTGIVVLISTIVCAMGLQNGLENVSKVMMISLLVIMVVLAVNSIFLPGAAEGLKFYLLPDFAQFAEKGFINVLVAAMNQAFFTLSIGMGSMAIFGSYIGKDRALMGEAVTVSLLDTFVAITAGLIIFPACFAYNVDVEAGPSLIFVTLPNIFNNMPFGRVWGSFFFIFMTFAAASTVFAVLENIISCTMELTGWKRLKASIVSGVGIFILSIPCILGFNVWSNVTILNGAKNIMDIEDLLVSNIILPLGALVYVVFCTTRWGIGWKKFTEEANTGKGMKVGNWMRWYMTFGLPVIILVIFVLGMISYFNV